MAARSSLLCHEFPFLQCSQPAASEVSDSQKGEDIRMVALDVFTITQLHSSHSPSCPWARTAHPPPSLVPVGGAVDWPLSRARCQAQVGLSPTSQAFHIEMDEEERHQLSKLGATLYVQCSVLETKRIWLQRRKDPMGQEGAGLLF